ncbi:hypothetical protein AUR64_15075 [Haloprofundus marisrubri]|uniref:Uncharacterized protein n=1 Tax=Haloprofundus marisrubri TaxID=1514971 RepID=A0A0W1R6R4_9EURY|nr:hypothetical protein [Haloprofundus marisrubri]KTG09117.1 hypothetical protein AUR64_15075 [Haloprofundus marisrubri]
MSTDSSPPSAAMLLGRFGRYIAAVVLFSVVVVVFGFQELLVVVWLVLALIPLYLLYRFVLAFERIADAAQRFASVRERESGSGSASDDRP